MDLRNRHVQSRRRAPGSTTATEKQAETEEQVMMDHEMGDDDDGDGCHGSEGRQQQQQQQQQQQHRVWLVYAITSGICAAFNGVFAKLTTTKLTADLSSGIAAFFGIPQHENTIQLLCRAIFFLLNLLFNGIMWTLFTSALKKSTSATQVAVMNTSTNFLVTAVAGLVIFSESLPPMWWAGASLLVAGSVIAGRRDRDRDREEQQQQQQDEAELEVAAAAVEEAGEHRGSHRLGGERELHKQATLKPYRDDPRDDEDVPHLDSL